MGNARQTWKKEGEVQPVREAESIRHPVLICCLHTVPTPAPSATRGVPATTALPAHGSPHGLASGQMLGP